MATNAVDFNGTTQYGLVPNYNEMEVGAVGTMEGWVYLDNESRDTYGVPFSIVDPGNTHGAYLAEDGSSQGINFSRVYSGADADGYTSTAYLSYATWVHMAIVFNTDVASKVYVGGSEISYTLQNNPSGTISSLDTYQFAIARFIGTAANRWNGRVACTRLWNTIRTGAELTNNKDYYLDPAEETGLVLNLNFDEGSGTTVDNDASAGNDLTLTGSPSWATGPTLTTKSYGGATYPGYYGSAGWF